MLRGSMLFLTDFADQFVIWPVTAAAGLALLLQQWRRGGAAFLGGVAATLLLLLALKFFCRICAALLPLGDLHNPSGHAGAAAVVYGGLTGLLLRRGAGRLRWLAAPLWAALFAATRLALHVHSLSDVVAGGAVGTVGALGLLWAAGPAPDGLRRLRPVLSALLVAMALHGHHLDAETYIRHAARFRFWPLSACSRPATREEAGATPGGTREAPPAAGALPARP